MYCADYSTPMEKKDNDKKGIFVIAIIISILLISLCLTVILCWKVCLVDNKLLLLSMYTELGLQTFIIICSLVVVIIGSVITIVLSCFKFSWGMFITGLLGVTSGVMQLIYLKNIQNFIDVQDDHIILSSLEVLKTIVIIIFLIMIILSVGLLICELVHNTERTFVMLLIAVYIICMAIGLKSGQIISDNMTEKSSIESIEK